jgi:hypothetical protein
MGWNWWANFVKPQSREAVALVRRGSWHPGRLRIMAISQGQGCRVALRCLESCIPVGAAGFCWVRLGQRWFLSCRILDNVLIPAAYILVIRSWCKDTSSFVMTMGPFACAWLPILEVHRATSVRVRVWAVCTIMYVPFGNLCKHARNIPQKFSLTKPVKAISTPFAMEIYGAMCTINLWGKGFVRVPRWRARGPSLSFLFPISSTPSYITCDHLRSLAITCHHLPLDSFYQTKGMRMYAVYGIP